MRRRQYTAILGFAATGLALAVPFIFGLLRSDYSHTRQYISELGERNAAQATLVNVGGFIPIGLMVLAFLALLAPYLPARRSARVGLVLLAGVGVAYLAAAAFPCDAGCPASGSTRQQIHNSLGLIEYGGAALGLVTLAQTFRTTAPWRPLWLPSLALGILIACALLLLLEPSATWSGLIQRRAEASIFGWITGVSYWLLAQAPKRQ